jgi:hypothetical protein
MQSPRIGFMLNADDRAIIVFAGDHGLACGQCGFEFGETDEQGDTFWNNWEREKTSCTHTSL